MSDKKVKKGNKIYILFGILSICLGFVFSILIPLYQVPDEETHINELYKFLGEDIIFSEETADYNDTLRIIRNYDEKVDSEKYFDLDYKLNIIDKVDNVSIFVIRYLPQSIGMLISEILNLPIILAVTIAELLAVIFYTFVGIKTLKLMPIKKELMMLIMLLPICIQQMGSFSYDMMLLSLSFLLIAYIFNLKFVKEEVTNMDLIKVVLMLSIIALIKLPYILLGLLIFIVPLSKIKLINQIKEIINTINKRILFVIGFIILCLIGMVFLINISYVKVLLAFIINPIDGIMLVLRTLKEHFGFYVMSIMGYFGWHDTPVSILFGVFVIVSLLLVNFSSGDDNNKFSKKDNIYMFVLGVLSSIIIVISLFDWTIKYNNIDTSNFSILDYSSYVSSMYDILGVQGKYFVPFIPLLILPFDFKIGKISNRRVLSIVQFVYYFVLTVYLFMIIINRYWI